MKMQDLKIKDQMTGHGYLRLLYLVGGDWKRGSGILSTKQQGWKTREWKSWHQNTGVENAGEASMESQIHLTSCLLKLKLS